MNIKQQANIAKSQIRGFHKYIRDNNGQCSGVIKRILINKQNELYTLQQEDNSLCIDPSYFT